MSTTSVSASNASYLLTPSRSCILPYCFTCDPQAWLLLPASFNTLVKLSLVLWSIFSCVVFSPQVMPVSLPSFTEIRDARCGGACGSWLLKEKMWAEKNDLAPKPPVLFSVAIVELQALTLPSNVRRCSRKERKPLAAKRSCSREVTSCRNSERWENQRVLKPESVRGGALRGCAVWPAYKPKGSRAGSFTLLFPCERSSRCKIEKRRQLLSRWTGIASQR